MIKILIVLSAIALTSAATAQSYTPWKQPDGSNMSGSVLNCAMGAGRLATPCGTPSAPITSAPAVPTWIAASTNTVSSANTYQQLFAAGQALRGGYIVNTSDPGDEPIWVDITGATGATLGNGAMPVYPAAAAGTAPGAWRIPPTTSAVTIYGPAGATFRAVRG